jgi:hypothetical protein
MNSEHGELLMLDEMLPNMVTLPNSFESLKEIETYKGNFAQKILLGIGSNGFVIDTEETIFDKILAASGMSQTDIKLLPINQQLNYSLATIVKHFKPHSFFVFGITATQMRWQIDWRLNTAYQFQNTTVIFTEPLHTINSNKESKMNFWNVWTTVLNIKPQKK